MYGSGQLWARDSWGVYCLREINAADRVRPGSLARCVVVSAARRTGYVVAMLETGHWSIRRPAVSAVLAYHSAVPAVLAYHATRFLHTTQQSKVVRTVYTPM